MGFPIIKIKNVVGIVEEMEASATVDRGGNRNGRQKIVKAEIKIKNPKPKEWQQLGSRCCGYDRGMELVTDGSRKRNTWK